jgi:hypothetical protein
MARKSPPLVCQFLERTSGKLLEKYGPVIRTYTRRRHGIYALYRRDRLYYVGLAKNLRNRLKHHLRDRHAGKWDSFSVYLTISDEHIRELESLILRIINPSGNKVRGKLRKAQNLLSKIRRDFTAQFRQEMNELFSVGLQRRLKMLTNGDLRDNGLTGKPGKPAVLARYTKERLRLRGSSRGKMFRAHVRRDGMIVYDGKVYRSPTLAAIAAGKTTRNGWYFWRYERAPGDWVKLKELRR